jgi:hypothetical protein
VTAATEETTPNDEPARRSWWKDRDRETLLGGYGLGHTIAYRYGDEQRQRDLENITARPADGRIPYDDSLAPN